MILSHIVAVSENNVIGKDNRLPWHMPYDMAYFKNTTWGHTVIMGRKNYEAEGKALKGRKNIIITRNKNLIINDGIVVNSINEAISAATVNNEEEIFIVGGGEIYFQTINLVSRIYLTRIHSFFEGEVFYPVIDTRIWQVVKKEFHKRDRQNPVDFTFFVYERIS